MHRVKMGVAGHDDTRNGNIGLLSVLASFLFIYTVVVISWRRFFRVVRLVFFSSWNSLVLFCVRVCFVCFDARCALLLSPLSVAKLRLLCVVVDVGAGAATNPCHCDIPTLPNKQARLQWKWTMCWLVSASDVSLYRGGWCCRAYDGRVNSVG